MKKVKKFMEKKFEFKNWMILTVAFLVIVLPIISNVGNSWRTEEIITKSEITCNENVEIIKGNPIGGFVTDKRDGTTCNLTKENTKAVEKIEIKILKGY